MGEVVGLGENIDGVVAVLRVLRNVCKGRFDGPSRAFEQVVKLISMTANVFFNRFGFNSPKLASFLIHKV